MDTQLETQYPNTCPLIQDIASCDASQHEVYGHVSEALNALNVQTKQFAAFEPDINEAELEAIERVRVEKAYSYEGGNIGTLLQDSKSFFRAIGNDEKTSELIAAVIYKFAHNATSASNQETSFTVIRATANNTTPSREWHIDSTPSDELPYCPLYYEVAHNFIMTLKGPGTLFYELSDDVRVELDAIENMSRKCYSIESKVELREPSILVRDDVDIYQAIHGIGHVFNMGDAFTATLHSAPAHAHHLERLMFLTVPTSYEAAEAILNPSKKK